MKKINRKLVRRLLESLRGLPVNTELKAESASRELAERTREDPERNERCSDEEGNARKWRTMIRYEMFSHVGGIRTSSQDDDQCTDSIHQRQHLPYTG